MGQGEQRQKIALLGSTGSIGVQTLDVVRAYSELFEVTTLTANDNWELLARQAIEFLPDSVVIANEVHYNALKQALVAYPIKVYAGSEAIEQVVAGGEVETVVNALVGYSGMLPTVAAIVAGKKIALANKESLVVAGANIMKLALENGVPILPIDSEHSAIFQCLVGESAAIERIILTASGGPFWERDVASFGSITVEQALRHPNWTMGQKITIDSATMLNKGFEVIEACWLFGVKPSNIEVVVHPQSVVHSMVEFADGAIKAQLGTADMHLPIQYALTFPRRMALPANSEKLSFSGAMNLTFLPADMEKFPCLRFAYECLERGGNSCCVLNAANEVAVAAFLERRIGFTDIATVIEGALAKATFVAQPTIAQLGESNSEAREIAKSFIKIKN